MSTHETHRLDPAISATDDLVENLLYADDMSAINALFDDEACCYDESWGDDPRIADNPHGDYDEIPMPNDEWWMMLAKHDVLDDFTEVPQVVLVPLASLPACNHADITGTPSSEAARPSSAGYARRVDIPHGALKVTTETAETYTVGNDAFLREVFGEPTAALPVVVSVPGDPRISKGWSGRPWDGKGLLSNDLSAEANNYFSLATFNRANTGEVRRKKANFYGLHAVMLDDVGTKADMSRLKLSPSWLLETSPDNYQVGYLLREPIMDGKAAERLMNAIVAAGLSDPGASGPTARLARLPVGVNGKHAPAFRCRLVVWAPERRYSMQDLIDGLELQVASMNAPSSATASVEERPDDGGPVLIPEPDENPVIRALKDKGLYKAPLGEGKHNITCPWVHEHSDEIDGGTAYFEPDDLYPVGGFKCLHGHCARRRIRDLMVFVQVEPRAARMKATIRVAAGEIHRVVDAAERELARCARYYQRGGMIVLLLSDPTIHETRIQDLSRPALARALAAVANWEKFNQRAQGWVRTDPPPRHVEILFDLPKYDHLPSLIGLTRQPYLRSDGSLMSAPGYDPATQLLGVFDQRAFSVPDHPTLAQAAAALALLKDLLAEFSFPRETDLAAALSAILTATVRPSLPYAPMFHVLAHMVGSGKSYLCKVFTAFATAQRGTPTTFPGDDEECRKLLLAQLLGSPAVMEFDNLTSDLIPHKSLCTVLTSEYFCGRILGVSKTATVSTRTLFLSSGNNVGPVQDMARRCVTIRLSPQCEVPAARSFKRPDLVREVLSERGRYVSAALTIVRAWIAAGNPRNACKHLAGYDDWSELCRQPLLWLGFPTPPNHCSRPSQKTRTVRLSIVS